MGVFRIEAEKEVAGKAILIAGHGGVVAVRDLNSWGELVKCLPWFVRIALLVHTLKVAGFTATHKALCVPFEPVPALANFPGLILGDGIILGSVGNTLQQAGELTDNFIGGREHAVVCRVAVTGVFDIVAITLGAEPLYDGLVPGVLVNFNNPV